MTLGPEQRVGIYILMNHWRERGTQSVEEMRLCRSLLARVDISADQIEQTSKGLEFDAGEVEAALPPKERRLLKEVISWREDALRANERRIPSWLAAADEAVKPDPSSSYEEPISTYTNAAFPLAGAVLLALKPSLATGVVAAALTLLGAASWRWHALQTDAAQALDEQSMYLTFGTLAGLAWSSQAVGALALGPAVGAVFGFFRGRADSFVAVPSLVVAACTGLGWPAGGVCLGVFALSAACRQAGEWLQPNSELAHDALHGAFHVLAAGGACLVVAFSVGALAV